jgi:tripartite ATP-independent transporter DctP family solute receptor
MIAPATINQKAATANREEKSMITRKQFLTGAAVTAASVITRPASAQQVRLRYAHVGVANAPQTLYADEVAKLVKERTQGRVEIQVFANSQLGGVGEMVDGIKSGAIAMGHHDFASLGKILANTAVFNTPFVYRDAEHSLRATDPRSSPALQVINAELVKVGGMRIVGSFFQGTRHLTSKEKVLSPKDMAGKKYRGVPVKLWSSMLTGMGAVATPVEVSELATALATGLVVGQENPLPNIFNLKLHEVQKFVMLTGHMQSVLSVFVNERIWQGVPAADRKLVEDTMFEVGQQTLKWDSDTAAKYRKDLEDKGMTFVEAKDGLDVEGFRTAVLAQIGKDFPEWKDLIGQIQAVK